MFISVYLRVFYIDIFVSYSLQKLIFDLTNCFNLTNGFVGANQFIKSRSDCVYIYTFSKTEKSEIAWERKKSTLWSGSSDILIAIFNGMKKDNCRIILIA